ncbi:CPBP family intramembrane metalloprotease [bacterium]|nr:CPBP family intramembrane metalloprotease [bacterium]
MSEQDNATHSDGQISLGKLVVLHILPGVLVAVFYVLAAPLMIKIGFPEVFALILSIFFITAPYIFVFLYYQGKKLNGRMSLEGVVLYREHLHWKQFALIFPVLFMTTFILWKELSPTVGFVQKHLFFWLPDWYLIRSGEISQDRVIVYFLVVFTALFFNGIAEELYFRGYLLPRMERFGWMAPVISTFLFAVYHVISPSFIVLRIIALFPMIYVTWRKRNVWLSIAVHVGLNISEPLAWLFTMLK